MTAGIEPRRLYTTAEAAALLNYSERTLRRWRKQGAGPRYTRYGAALRYGYFGYDLVRYLRDEQARYMKEGARQ